MIDQSLPNLDCDESDSGSHSTTEEVECDYYVLRITPHDKFTFEEFRQYVHEDRPEILHYVLSKEIAARTQREHFHMVFSVAAGTVDVKDYFTTHWLYKYWYTEEGKLPRGFGNSQYNMQRCNDLDKAISYACKDKDFVFQTWSSEYIESLAAQSFNKKSPTDFKSEYRLLCEEFQNNKDKDVRWFMVKYVELKGKYGQGVNIQVAHQYALSALVRRDPEESARLVDNFLRYNKHG